MDLKLPKDWKRRSLSSQARWLLKQGMSQAEATEFLNCSRQIVFAAATRSDKRGRPRKQANPSTSDG